MKILYVAPRYHTNQTAIIHGWQEHGDDVCFVARTQGPIEDHSYIEPIILPYSSLFRKIEKLYIALRPNDPSAHDLGLRYGFPSGRRFRKIVDDFKPDMVVLREKSIYSIVCWRQLRRKGIRTYLYNQSPMWELPENIHYDFGHRLMNILLPLKRYTPVRERDFSFEGKIKTENSYFVPFVVELRCKPEDKQYKKDGRIHILDVGRFERRKNHLLMVEAFAGIHQQFPETVLTIVGEIGNDFDREYEKEVRALIRRKNLNDVVTILPNRNASQMDALYRETDIYVLPSTGEPAAISPLEAMSYSIPAICSTGNGTADYIEEGISGFVFKDNDVNSLKSALQKIASSEAAIRRMGAAAYRNVSEHYVFNNYLEALQQIP